MVMVADSVAVATAVMEAREVHEEVMVTTTAEAMVELAREETIVTTHQEVVEEAIKTTSWTATLLHSPADSQTSIALSVE